MNFRGGWLPKRPDPADAPGEVVASSSGAQTSGRRRNTCRCCRQYTGLRDLRQCAGIGRCRAEPEAVDDAIKAVHPGKRHSCLTQNVRSELLICCCDSRTQW